MKTKGTMARLAARGAAVCAWIRGSAWISIGGRAMGIAFALFVLAWIGRNAVAGEPPPVDVMIASAALSPAQVARPPGEDAGAAVSVEASAPVAAATAAPPRGRASATEPVYVNLADETELRRLPGVGAKRAAAILALRQKLGRFTRVEDLLRVKGVGRTTLKKWRPLVRLDATRAES